MTTPLTRTAFVIRDPTGKIIASDELPPAGALLSVGIAHAF